jgi:putative transposase
MTFLKRTYRIRAYPNAAQQRQLQRWFGATRWLWNTTLAIRSEAYRVCGLTLTGNDLSLWLTQWKRTPGHAWLAELPSTILTQCLRDQDRAFSNFFARRAYYPRFKRRSSRASVRFQGVGVSWTRGQLSMPKLGVLRLAEALPEVARPDMVTLTRDAAGRYHVSFCAQVEKPSLPIVQRSVGVDLGVQCVSPVISQTGC